MEKSKSGYATYRRGKLYFDEVGWAMIKGAAKRLHRSPKQVVIAALMRYARLHKNEKA
jgi:hypothetical protein